ncbi:hypothetical protein LWI28_012398 [Acer negundo]|uniref:Dirigent protein n=1 Tax=Acer negundo TaxID=4023 RepID=A0AAD5ICJ6_ACENE|nr:hypothetical protein LWI28_012398 [Acer negundo]KAK4836049.1 hypothetical protein QYF36_017874 [Acer negundo]
MANISPSKLNITWFLIFFIFINQKSSSSARKLGSSTHNHDHYHNKITFFMQDVLNFNASSPKTTKLTSSTHHHHLPFPKPLGLFPPNRGIPISESESAVPATTQTLDVSNVGIFFPPRAALQELEFGTLVIVEEDLFEHYSSLHGSPRSLGKAQGVYVATSEDGTSHMMSMTASFSDTGFKDGLRFFGVHRKDRAESHIAVIGGTGKYDGANGYATVKARVLSGSKVGAQEQEANKYLLFNVYLS